MAETDYQIISTHNLSWLLAGLIMSTLPHSMHMPVWIFIIFFLLTAWRMLEQLKNLKPPTKNFSLRHIAQIMMMIGGFIGVYMYFGTLIGRDAGVALLILLTGFKILEIRGVRDFYVTNFLGYFLIITNFFYTRK